MAALVAAIHVFFAAKQDVDGRHKAGHDDSTRPKFALANAALVPGLDFFKGAGIALPFFPSLPKKVMERREAPGVCETPWDAYEAPRGGPYGTASPDGQGLRGLARRRDPSDVGACASRRSTATPARAPHPVSAAGASRERALAKRTDGE